MTMIKQKCDFCKEQAEYDGKTKFGPWAYMCTEHLEKYGFPNVKGLHNKLQQPEQPPVTVTKRCVVCGKEKPIEEFYQYIDHGGHQRFRNDCKECNLAAKKLHSFKKK